MRTNQNTAAFAALDRTRTDYRSPHNRYSRSVMESYTPYPPHRIRQANSTNNIHSPTPAVGSTSAASVGLPKHFTPEDHHGMLGLSPLGTSHSDLPPSRHPYGANEMHHVGPHHPPHGPAGVLGPSPSSGSTSFTPPDILNNFEMTDDLFRPWICSTDGGNLGSGSQTGDHHGFPNGHQMDPLAGLGGGGYDWDLPGPSSARKLPSLGGNDTGITNDSMFQDFDATMANVTGSGVNNPPHNHRQSASSQRSQSHSALSPAADTGPLASIEDLTRWSTILTFLSLYFEHL